MGMNHFAFLSVGRKGFCICVPDFGGGRDAGK